MQKLTLITFFLGSLLFWWGTQLGRQLVRHGATANDLFQGKNSLSLVFVLGYIGLIVLALYVPQFPVFPMEWRAMGMEISWAILRLVLLASCGIAWSVCWQTARVQAIAVILIVLLGLGSFNATESYFLAPIYASLQDHLQANGVFKQTSASSCAPAALATLLRMWHIPATESSVAQVARTNRLGTSMPQLVMAVRSFGLEALEMTPSWEQMRLVNRPGVLSVWLFKGLRKMPHAVTLLGIQDDLILIADPARGKIFELTRPEFDLIWRGQYLPVFRVQDTALSQVQAAEYLTQWGYLQPGDEDFQSALRRFQTAVSLPATGKLNPQTALLLQGPFLENAPRLYKGDRNSDIIANH